MSANQKIWARHYQDHWMEKTSNRGLPAWLRVALLAYGKHRANGHARFGPGEIALVLARVDKDTGEITPMDKANVQRAIRGAIQAGWLDERSNAKCLVVPGHHVEGGYGNPGEECDRHHRHEKGAARPKLRAV